MAKITVTYTFDVEAKVAADRELRTWTKEGDNCHYFYESEEGSFWFMCDDKMLVVRDELLLTFEFSGENVVDRNKKKK